MTKKEQTRQFASWIWSDRETDIRRIAYNDKYAVGEVDNGSVIEWLTPFLPIPELLAYLQGIHTVINVPYRFNIKKTMRWTENGGF